MISLTEILRDNRFIPADLPEFESKLYFEGERRRQYLVRFTVLMFFATVIATGGIILDSTATVIGISILLVTIPLFVTTIRATSNSVAQVRIGRIAQEWIDQLEDGYSIESIKVLDQSARIRITGPEAPDSISDISEQIEAEVDRVNEVRLRFIPSRDIVHIVGAPD